MNANQFVAQMTIPLDVIALRKRYVSEDYLEKLIRSYQVKERSVPSTKLAYYKDPVID